MSRLVWNPAAECQKPAERAALQLERLQRTLRWAADRVPFYRDGLAAAGVGPGAVRSLDQLPALPFTRYGL